MRKVPLGGGDAARADGCVEDVAPTSPTDTNVVCVMVVVIVDVEFATVKVNDSVVVEVRSTVLVDVVVDVSVVVVGTN